MDSEHAFEYGPVHDRRFIVVSPVGKRHVSRPRFDDLGQSMKSSIGSSGGGADPVVRQELDQYVTSIGGQVVQLFFCIANTRHVVRRPVDAGWFVRTAGFGDDDQPRSRLFESTRSRRFPPFFQFSRRGGA